MEVGKEMIFYLLHITILNSYIILTSCGSETDHQKFCLNLVQNLLEWVDGSLDFNPVQEEGQTHKPIKWFISKQSTLVIGQMQDCTYGAMCVQQKKKK
jgi:hypothetical protein